MKNKPPLICSPVVVDRGSGSDIQGTITVASGAQHAQPGSSLHPQRILIEQLTRVAVHANGSENDGISLAPSVIAQ